VGTTSHAAVDQFPVLMPTETRVGQASHLPSPYEDPLLKKHHVNSTKAPSFFTSMGMLKSQNIWSIFQHYFHQPNDKIPSNLSRHFLATQGKKCM
jgi:hypothetical protein